MSKKTPSWATIEKRVLAPFDRDTPAMRYAIAQWRDTVAKARSSGDESVHLFSSPKVIEAAIEFFRADIIENEAFFRLSVSRDSRRAALMTLRTTLGEHDGYFVDEERGERVVPERLAVIHIDASARQALWNRVVEASAKLAQGNGDNVAEEVEFPAELGEGIQKFATDLKEFLRHNGEEGRTIVERLCEDRDFAAKTMADQEMPQPLRFLAQIVVETATKNRLPDRPAGFGFARR